MHTPYEEILGYPPDFRVRYRFYTKEEGGRLKIPYQGIRSDFWYEDPSHKPNQIFIIWPEFEDENGNVILENDKSVPSEGIARMWIIIPEMRSYHRERIKPGTIGFFREGSRSTGVCEVIELLGLTTNPTSKK
jgi:hypothetical protein